MRVVLVGSSGARARLLARLPDGMDVVGEAASMDRAHEVEAPADAWLVAPPTPPSTVAADEDEELAGAEPLTPRELEVIGLVANGLSNRSIAARLRISDQTVKFHVASIYGKLGASNRTDASRRALRLGLIAL